MFAGSHAKKGGSKRAFGSGEWDGKKQKEGGMRSNLEVEKGRQKRREWSPPSNRLNLENTFIDWTRRELQTRFLPRVKSFLVAVRCYLE